MANKSRFVVAESSIKNFFKQNPRKVFSREQLRDIFNDRRAIWNLSLSTYPDKFIEQLLSREVLKAVTIKFSGYIPEKERFISEDVSIFQLATSLINKSYISHYSAVFLNGLTTQVPKVVYITFEQSEKPNTNRSLNQSAIDTAFSKPQKATSSAEYGDYTFLVLNGMYTNRIGLSFIEDITVTNIERTLIDIAVRPNYAGGVHSVLEAYKNALKSISINKLIAILDSMNFIYPYQQVIGFYLEKAGYKGKKLIELNKKQSDFDFYLTYEMEEKEYSHEWKLYYPKGM